MEHLEERKQTRRVRWPVWLAGGIVLLLIAVVVAHAIWTARGRRMLARQVALIESRGEPIRIEQFNPAEETPDHLNAAIPLRQAAIAVDAGADDWRDLQLHARDLPLLPHERRRLAAVIAARPDVLPTFDQATTRPAVDWGVRYVTPVYNALMPDLSQQRTLANFVAEHALLAHDAGDESDALADLARLAFHARAIDQQGLLVNHLVAAGVLALAASTAQDIAPDLRVGPADDAATPEEVRSVIDALLDDAHFTDGMRRAFLSERMAMLDLADAMTSGKIPPGQLLAFGVSPALQRLLGGNLGKPIVYHDVAIMLRHVTEIMDASAAPNWPEVVAKMPPPEPPEATGNGAFLHVFASLFLPPLDHFAETHFRVLAERRLAAVALAIAWYRAEHDGRWPDSLDALVPRYLPAVPIDPMASDDAPLGYDPLRRIVWSAGTDGVNADGDPTTQPASARLSRPSRWQLRDAVVPLQRQPRDLEAAEPVPAP